MSFVAQCCHLEVYATADRQPVHVTQKQNCLCVSITTTDITNNTSKIYLYALQFVQCFLRRAEQQRIAIVKAEADDAAGNNVGRVT